MHAKRNGQSWITSLQASASVGSESERSLSEGAANSYQDSIKAQYQSGEAKRADNGVEAFDEQQHQHQQEQLHKLLQDEQVHHIACTINFACQVLKHICLCLLSDCMLSNFVDAGCCSHCSG